MDVCAKKCKIVKKRIGSSCHIFLYRRMREIHFTTLFSLCNMYKYEFDLSQTKTTNFNLITFVYSYASGNEIESQLNEQVAYDIIIV